MQETARTFRKGIIGTRAFCMGCQQQNEIELNFFTFSDFQSWNL